ncbi:unnamed protein product [Paramecium sonneborni]|uniref:Uncharacterized protein n=1 Tax=Paramecium sonneborni TaxID=65129 RepID=A0A8S1MQH3_9CILI|nr:unnamed protein product [Paramecium sonneborni]
MILILEILYQMVYQFMIMTLNFLDNKSLLFLKNLNYLMSRLHTIQDIIQKILIKMILFKCQNNHQLMNLQCKNNVKIKQIQDLIKKLERKVLQYLEVKSKGLLFLELYQEILKYICLMNLPVLQIQMLNLQYSNSQNNAQRIKLLLLLLIGCLLLKIVKQYMYLIKVKLLNKAIIIIYSAQKAIFLDSNKDFQIKIQKIKQLPMNYQMNDFMCFLQQRISQIKIFKLLLKQIIISFTMFSYEFWIHIKSYKSRYLQNREKEIQKCTIYQKSTKKLISIHKQRTKLNHSNNSILDYIEKFIKTNE